MERRPNSTHDALARAEGASETTETHTRKLCLALGIEESRSYWERSGSAVHQTDRGLIAFEERWFGEKSLERVRFLVSPFSERYDAYPHPDFTIDETRSDEARANFLRDRDREAREILAKELKRRERKRAKAEDEYDAGPLFEGTDHEQEDAVDD